MPVEAPAGLRMPVEALFRLPKSQTRREPSSLRGAVARTHEGHAKHLENIPLLPAIHFELVGELLRCHSLEDARKRSDHFFGS